MSGIFSLNTPHAPEKNKNAIKNNEPVMQNPSKHLKTEHLIMERKEQEIDFL